MKRQDGNTTRTIDHAIQMLFNKGSIKIPTTLREEERRSWYGEQLIYDPACTFADVSISGIQKDLLYRVKRRLEIEHKYVKFEFNGSIIRIKQ